MSRRVLVVLALALLAVVTAVGAALHHQRSRRGTPAAAGPSGALSGVPDATGTRIKVQVLNATDTRGLARRAAFYLRDRGFDVVEMGNAGRRRDSTLVLDRSRHPEWARRVAQAVGGARVESRPDSSRYLDITVLLGAQWRPPAEPFYP